MAATILFAIPPGLVRADGFPGERLIRADRRVAASPEDPAAFWRRAELRREVGDFDGALEDLDRAAGLAPAATETAILRARVYLDSGQALAALEVLGVGGVAERGAGGRRPARRAAEAQRLKAESLLKLGRPAAAADAFSQAIAFQPGAAPALYLARARAQVAVGVEALPAALAGLDEGIEAMGPVPALVRESIEIELALGHVDQALLRIAKASAASQRRETWLEWRGQILEEAGRRPEALAAYQDAIDELSKNSSIARSSPAMSRVCLQMTQKDSCGDPWSTQWVGNVIGQQSDGRLFKHAILR